MAIHTLSIDVETFSGVDLKKCGVYKYAESPNFEILLFGVSVDGGEVTVYDLASGDTVPEEIIRALSDDSVIKWAYNASFERVCLSVWLRRNYPQYFSSYSIEGDTVRHYFDPASWRCSLVWGAYMGLPLSLEGIGKVLKAWKIRRWLRARRSSAISASPVSLPRPMAAGRATSRSMTR